MKLIYRNQSQGQKILNVMLLTAFLSLVLAYIIGVSYGHHEPWLPTISELDEFNVLTPVEYTNKEGVVVKGTSLHSRPPRPAVENTKLRSSRFLVR